MSTLATVHYEKRVVDGRPRFVPVSMFTVLQERIDSQRQSFLEGAAKAGLQSLLSEVAGASYAQMGTLVRALTDVGQTTLQSPCEEGDRVAYRQIGLPAGEAPGDQSAVHRSYRPACSRLPPASWYR